METGIQAAECILDVLFNSLTNEENLKDWSFFEGEEMTDCLFNSKLGIGICYDEQSVLYIKGKIFFSLIGLKTDYRYSTLERKFKELHEQSVIMATENLLKEINYQF